MSSYQQWNSAILHYLLEGVPRGSQVFLSIDDDVLKQVARDLVDVEDGGVADFCKAVHSAVVGAHRIDLAPVSGLNDDGEPSCLAFLSAMVLAATRMADEIGDASEISSANYFRRLREVLGLPPAEGRASGLEAGAEEPLWLEWGQWLQERGYVASARHGEGPRRYIEYPISQAILRGADKDRLCRLFSDKHWPTTWDQDTVVASVQREAHGLTQHIQELLRASGLHYAAVADGIYDVYDAWQADPHMASGRADAMQSNHIMAGLLRTADIFSGTVEYFLYPRAPRRRRLSSVSVQGDGQTYKLVPDRPGWFAPPFAVQAADLTGGRRYRILAPDDLEWLILPERDFWVLVPDPENEESDARATWGSPPLGFPFMLLCRRELIPQLEHLRNERVLEWRGDPRPLPDSEEWVEVKDCMLVSEASSGIFIDNQALLEALRPRALMYISLSGGLRAPNVPGWVEGYGPQVMVIGFEQNIDVQIKNVADNHTLLSEEQHANVPFPYEWPQPGDYIIEAECGGELTTRLVKIVAWAEINEPIAEGLDSRTTGREMISEESETNSEDAHAGAVRLETIELDGATLTGAHLVVRSNNSQEPKR